MTVTGSDRYQVIVSRRAGEPEAFNYQLARERAAGEPGDRLELLGDLVTPACEPEQARQMALTWLRQTRPEYVAGFSLDVVWAVLDPDAAPSRGAGGVVRYATVRRRWRLRGRG